MAEKLAACAIGIRDALKARKTIIIACHCSIAYSGRAESFLDFGDRIIIVKQDAALLVHQPANSNPVNYMKPESQHSISLLNGILSLKSTNIPLKEYMDIAITLVHFWKAELLEDNKSIEIQGTEKDMSDMIFSNPCMIEPGFTPLSQEEHTKYGFIDVFGFDNKNVLTVIECKRYIADPSAVDQLNRYVKKIKDAKGVKSVRGILAAPKISPSAKRMLDDLGLEFKALAPPKFLERYQKSQKALGDF